MKPVITTGALGLVALLAAAPASGQQAARPERPYRGLFAGDRGNAGGNSGQELVFNASLGGGYDDNILADALRHTGPGTAPTGQDGVLSNAGAGLTYSLNLDRFVLEAAANGGVRYYPSFPGGERMVPSEDGRIGTSWRLTGSTTLSARASITRRPENLDRLFAPVADMSAGVETNDLDLPTTFDHYRRYGGSAALTQKITSRLTFQADYGRRWAEGQQGPRVTSQRVGGGLTVGVARGLALKAGYRYAQTEYFGVDPKHGEHHNIDAGVNYSRALSFSRRTTLSFSTGSSAVQHEGRLRYGATGNADLTHEIGRTWAASLAYVRGARFVETWDEPLFSDVVTASLSGLINRRVELTSGAGASARKVGVAASDRGFRSYWGTANLSIALTRYVNFGIDYLYTQHRFDGGVAIPAGWQGGERQRVSAHIGLWMPLITTTRRSDVTR